MTDITVYDRDETPFGEGARVVDVDEPQVVGTVTRIEDDDEEGWAVHVRWDSDGKVETLPTRNTPSGRAVCDFLRVTTTREENP